MEPCYKLHHHGTKRSLDLAMSSERSSVGRVAEGGRSEPALLGGERGTRENCAGSIVPLAFSYVGKALELYDGKLLWGLVQTPLHYCYYPTKPAQSQSPALTCCGWALATVLTAELGTFIWLLSHEWDLPSTGSLNVRAFMLFRGV